MKAVTPSVEWYVGGSVEPLEVRLGAKGGSLPRLFQGLAAAGQTVYGTETDPDGLPLVVRYYVVRR